jgi:hypothetical protein
MKVINNSSAPYYDSITEFLQEDDLCELDVHLVGLEKQFRIRALDFAAMEKINQLSGKDGVMDTIVFTIQTIVHGVVRPKINPEQAQKLITKNGAVIRELADQIWLLSRITPKTLQAYLEVNK